MALEKTNRLKELLKQIVSQQSDVATVESQLDGELGRDCAVMVSDFSSFLGLARDKGIVSALSMVEKAHEIAAPILSALGGEVLRAEPDMLVVVFPKTIDAVMAARAVSRTFETNNKEATEDKLAVCIGIGKGRMLVTDDQVYGDQAMIAARLGEAVEGEFEVRLTPEAHDDVQHLESISFSESDPVMIAGVSIAPYKLIFA